MIQYFAIFSLTLFLFYVLKSMIKPKNFPPAGPRWYPFVGSSRQVYSKMQKYGSQFKAFLELSKEYSTDILGLSLGNELVVIFYGQKNFKQVMLSEEFDGRPDNFFMRMRCFGKRAGMSLVDGPLWKIHRKFTMSHLRNAGYGKGPMERDIQNSSQELAKWILSQGNQPQWPKDFLPLAVLNVLWKCAAGETIPQEKFDYLQSLLQKRGSIFNLTGGLLNRAPWIRHVLPGYSGYLMLLEVNKLISGIVEETILRHKNKVVPGHDLIYAFLEEMAQNRETFTDEQLIVICIDLIMAGSATTSHAMEFAILQVLRDQPVQRKLQAEIDQVLGADVACWADTARLPYTSAFLQEMHRVHTVAPLIGPKRVLRDVSVNGYVIPKNTTVLVSAGDMHVDPALWEDPLDFKPERFLDCDGKFVQSDLLHPFGLGRRRCPGETLARMFVFITLITLLQHFTITCADDHLPSTEPEPGMFASPKRFRALFVPREKVL